MSNFLYKFDVPSDMRVHIYKVASLDGTLSAAIAKIKPTKEKYKMITPFAHGFRQSAFCAYQKFGNSAAIVRRFYHHFSPFEKKHYSFRGSDKAMVTTDSAGYDSAKLNLRYSYPQTRVNYP